MFQMIKKHKASVTVFPLHLLFAVERIQISYTTRAELIESKNTYEIIERGFVDVFVSMQQESPALTQEAYRPPCSKCLLCCSVY